ncbi:uncharacterized protein SAZU_1404 [Streptomyces azureus]|uniref:Uncharacterized protein n=1 Tax=Streptomyces azureus TaxID=146537 RepID=A0A0K8PFJ4_STRAJ|nr:uncharacterized protein SAZU_1404 [Streptomyces azureus]
MRGLCRGHRGRSPRREAQGAKPPPEFGAEPRDKFSLSSNRFGRAGKGRGAEGDALAGAQGGAPR